jgi:imidazolonepropionase-like amidohydrolase
MDMRLLIKRATYLDYLGGLGFVSKDLLIEGDRISLIGDQIDPLSSDLTVDLDGLYVLPGLIDMHVHLCWDGSVDPTVTLASESRELTLLRMVRHARETIFSGITTVRDLGAVADLSLVLSEAIQKGIATGPRIFGTGKSLIMTGGHDPFWGISADGPWEAVKMVRQQVEKGASVIKVSATGGVYGRKEGEDVGQSELSRDELTAICLEAHRLGLRVASHALGKEGVENSVLAGCDTIEHGIFASEETLRKMAELGTYLTPTLFIYRKIAQGNAPEYAKEKAKKVVDMHRRCFLRAMQEGVKILAGSDAGSPEAPHPSLFQEMEEMVRMGLSPLEVIRISTLINAEALGLGHLIGSIEQGKLADLIILTSNPAEHLNMPGDLWGVMQSGIFLKRGNQISSPAF